MARQSRTADLRGQGPSRYRSPPAVLRAVRPAQRRAAREGRRTPPGRGVWLPWSYLAVLTCAERPGLREQALQPALGRKPVVGQRPGLVGDRPVALRPFRHALGIEPGVWHPRKL